MITIPELSKALKQALKTCGVTQAWLRESAGVSRQTMNNVLGGKADYKVSTLLAVADRLGLEVVLVPKSAARGLGGFDQGDEVQIESVVDRARKLIEKI
jgi:DNA-binding XRE family transcriptional regulator